MLLSLSVSKMMTSATTCLSWCHIVSLALPICFIVPNETDWQHGSCREWNQKRMQEM